MNHTIWMVIGCVVPLLLLFLLPIFGVRNEITFYLFLILMFVAHLFMMGGHGHEHNREEHDSDEPHKH